MLLDAWLILSSGVISELVLNMYGIFIYGHGYQLTVESQVREMMKKNANIILLYLKTINWIKSWYGSYYLRPLLKTWYDFNPSMDEYFIIVRDYIIYLFSNFSNEAVEAL